MEIGRELAGVHGLDELLRLVLQAATAFSGYDGASILLLSGPRGPLTVRASFGPDAAPVGSRSRSLGQSVAGLALRERRPIVLAGEGEEVGTVWREYTKPIPSSVCLPLLTTEGEPIGVLALKSSRNPRTPGGDELDGLQLLAGLVASVVESARLRERLEERERRLAALVERLLTAQEEERRRAARDLHDGVTQLAAATLQHLQGFEAHHRPRSPGGRDELARALELARRTVAEARRLIADLRPTTLDDFGLATALRRELGALAGEGWESSFDERLGAGRLPPSVETALYRVGQEALANVRRHAGRCSVRVGLRRLGGAVALRVRDRGQGFDPGMSERGPAGEHVGLMTIRERVDLLGGRFRVWSRPGRGTSLLAVIPLEPEQPDA